MSLNNTGSGGVRNLRAMFENKAGDHSTSPPSRSRSPNSSDKSSHSRPVSVRTSFVAVDRPGELGQSSHWGLRKASDVSSMAEVKEEALGINSAVTNTTEQTKSAPAPTSPHTSKNSIDGGLGTILKGSAFEPATPAKASEGKRFAQALSASKARNKEPVAPKTNGDPSKSAAMVKKMQPTEDKPQPPPMTKLTTTATAHPVKAPPTRQVHPKPSASSPNMTKQNIESPTSPAAPILKNLRGGPAKIKGVMESASRAKEARESMARKEDTGTAKEAEQSTANVNGTKKEIVTSPKNASTPKSPSKPAKLPSAATATTAASAAHTLTESDLRRSVAKRPSAISLKQKAPSTNTPTLAKKSSRASLANANDRPGSRVSAGKPDESFLARMTRPTASSAQKVHEKAPVSPPRPRQTQTVARPKPKPPRMSLKGSKTEDTSAKENTVDQPESPNAVKDTTVDAQAERGEIVAPRPVEEVTNVNGAATIPA